MLEYRKCTTTGKMCHYTEFVKAGWGWLASDGSKRHSQSKIGKRVNQSLSNGLRVFVDGILVTIGHSLHPNNLGWVKIKQQVRDEHPEYSKPLLRGDLTKEAYIRMYVSLGMEIPDLEKVLYKKHGRGSSNSDKCLDYLEIPKDDTHREVKIGKYFVDGLLDNDVYEFYGDFFHANPKIYSEQTSIIGYTAGEKWKKDKERAKFIKSRGYNFNIIWESDWNDFQQGSVADLKILS
jgi:hypothetical protein